MTFNKAEIRQVLNEYISEFGLDDVIWIDRVTQADGTATLSGNRISIRFTLKATGRLLGRPLTMKGDGSCSGSKGASAAGLATMQEEDAAPPLATILMKLVDQVMEDEELQDEMADLDVTLP